MTDIVVTLPPELVVALDELAHARGHSRAALAAEAVARFVLEERQAIDRVVQARLEQLYDDAQDPAEEEKPPASGSLL